MSQDIFEFSPKKTVQASCVLLREHEGQMSRLRLLKMLYMGDRALLKEIGTTITGDKAYAMKNGPVLSRCYALIKGTDSALSLWGKYIHNRGPRDLVLVRNPGVGCLSEFEIETLKAITKQFWEEDDYAVADFTHNFPEWKKNEPSGSGRKDISFDDVIEALGLQEMKDAIIAEAKSRNDIEKTFAQAHV